MRQYIRNYIWEYIVCVITCGTLLLNLAQGFYIPDRMADSLPLAFGSCAVLLLVFYLISYNKTGMVIGLVAALIAVVGAFFLMRARGVDIVDKEGSDTAYLIYWFVFALCCIGVYFLSRFRIGVAVIFLTGICLNAVLAYLHFESRTWTTILFCIGCLLLFLLRQFRYQAMHSSIADPKFGKFTAMAAVLVLAATLIGTGIYYAAIKPADPPTLSVKLFERYVIYDILQALGIADDYPLYGIVYGPQQDEDTDDDNEEETIDSQNEAENATQPEDREPQGTTPLATLVLQQLTPAVLLLIALGIVLLIVLPPLIKQWLRKRRIKRFCRLEGAEQIKAFYGFYLKEFAVLGWGRNAWETPEEYEDRCKEHLTRFLTDTCGLSRLTELFSDVKYAERQPEKEDCAAVRQIYPQLLKNSKKQLGFVRYALKYYVL